MRRHLTAFASIVLLFTLGMAWPLPAARAQADKYAPLFDAMSKSRHNSIDVELRNGALQAFETAQRVEQFPLGQRHDLLPFSQPELLRKLKIDPDPSGQAIHNASYAEFIDACVARDDFAELALFRGSETADPRPFVRLLFTRAQPTTFESGPLKLVLSPEMLRYISVNAQHSKRVENATRLAVIVHEPHSSRFGQFQMIKALRMLLPEPLSQKALFLVEGDYWGDDRKIGTGPWDQLIGRGAAHGPEIRQLVRDYWINGVFASRLLRTDDDIPSYAIDDRQLLQQTPRMPDPGELGKAIASSGLSEEERQVWQAVVLSSSALRDPQAYEKLVDLIDAEISKANEENKKVLKEVKSLVEVYKCAALRNETMAREVDQRMQQHADAVPYIFIGNFHTDGVLTRLRKLRPDTQFIVLDVRGSYEDGGDHKAFQDALQGKPGVRTLAVTPRPESREALARRVAEIRAKSAEVGRDSEVDPKLREALLQRGLFRELLVKAGGQQPPPPPPAFKSAFASFEPDPKGLGGLLVVHDHEGDGWKEPDRRLAVIHELVSMTPTFGPELSRMHFKIDGRTFVVFGDKKTKRFYFMEYAVAGATLEKIVNSGEEPKEANYRIQQLTERNKAKRPSLGT